MFPNVSCMTSFWQLIMEIDNGLYFIHSRGRFTSRGYLDPPRIVLCLGRKFPLFLHLLLIGKSCDGILQVVYFMS